MPRRRRSAGLFAGLTAVVVLAVPLAVGSMAVAAPVTQEQGARTVAVSESELPDTDAVITVTGSGFDPAVDTYLAVCRADIAGSDPLTNCVGGPVPDENDTAGWAEVTSEPEGKRNSAVFGDGGTFSVDLTLTSAADAGVDCVTEGCVLVVRSAGEEADRPADITVGLAFAAPSSSASASSASETSTASEAPATVGPDTVALPDASVGQQQTVVFTGFAPDEEVGVTVFSEPVNIDGVVASPAGVVAITFPVTEALVPGTHTVQAIGRRSGVIGIASFTVVAAPVTTSAPVESSTSAPTTEASSAPVTTAAPTSEPSTSAAVTTGEATTTGEAAPAEPAESGQSLWWVWVTLALLVVAVAVAVAVTASRRRAQQLEQEQLDREQELAAMAAANPPTWAGGTGAPYSSPAARPGYEPYDPGQSYGLLSGREGDGPALYSGQGLGGQAARDDEPPTRWIDPDDRSADLPTTAIRPDSGGTPPPAAPSTPPATQRFDPSRDDADAPRTEQWSPFGDEDEGGGEPPRRP
jgi:hypothetical protein